MFPTDLYFSCDEPEPSLSSFSLKSGAESVEYSQPYGKRLPVSSNNCDEVKIKNDLSETETFCVVRDWIPSNETFSWLVPWSESSILNAR